MTMTNERNGSSTEWVIGDAVNVQKGTYTLLINGAMLASTSLIFRLKMFERLGLRL